LKRETRTQLKNAIHIAAYQDIAIAISRRFLRPSTAFPHNIQQADPAPAEADADTKEGMDIKQWMGHIANLQAAHSSHVAGMVYSRGIQEQAGTTAHQQEIFQLSSTD
jgi:GH25 family lysozyme M1 (1,4-beta-N-acetylmuramidase)